MSPLCKRMLSSYFCCKKIITLSKMRMVRTVNKCEPRNACFRGFQIWSNIESQECSLSQFTASHSRKNLHKKSRCLINPCRVRKCCVTGFNTI